MKSIAGAHLSVALSLDHIVSDGERRYVPGHRADLFLLPDHSLGIVQKCRFWNNGFADPLMRSVVCVRVNFAHVCDLFGGTGTGECWEGALGAPKIFRWGRGIGKGAPRAASLFS